MTSGKKKMKNKIKNYPRVRGGTPGDAAAAASPHDATASGISLLWCTVGAPPELGAGTTSPSCTAAASLPRALVLLDNVVETHLNFVNHLHLSLMQLLWLEDALSLANTGDEFLSTFSTYFLPIIFSLSSTTKKSQP